MKLNIILPLVLLHIFCSCNRLGKEEKTTGELENVQKTEEYEKEIESLKAKLADSQATIDSLMEKERGSINRRDILLFDKSQIISQILGDNFSVDDFNEKTFNFIFTELRANELPFEDFIAHNPIFVPRTLGPDEECFSSVHYGDRGIDTPDYMCKLNKLYSNFDRTPNNISKVFNESTLNHIASLFNYGIVQKDYKLYGLLQGLLMTYEELDNDECERLYQLLHLEEIDYFKYEEDCSQAFEDIISDNVRNYVTATPYVQHINNSSAGHEKRMFYLYSFWARRYNEGNKEAVYKILTRLNEKID